MLGLASSQINGLQSYGDFLSTQGLITQNTLSLYTDPVTGNQQYLFGTFNTNAISLPYLPQYDIGSGLYLWEVTSSSLQWNT